MKPLCDGCGRPPFIDADGKVIRLRACSACKAAFYHDANCQQKHRKLHRAECNRIATSRKQSGRTVGNAPRVVNGKWVGTSERVENIHVEIRKGRGRSVFASRPLHNGEDIGVFDPVVAPVLISQQRDKRCVVCFQRVTSGSPQPSLSCGLKDQKKYTVRFCSRLCCDSIDVGNETTDGKEQLSDQSYLYQDITTECEIVKAFLDHHPGFVTRIFPTSLLLFRILLLRSRRQASFCGEEIDELHPRSSERDSSIFDKPSQSEDEMTHRLAVIAIVQRLWFFFKRSGAFSHYYYSNSAVVQVSPEILMNLYDKVKFNAFTVQDHKNNDEGIGFGVFQLPASFMNHSCCPNALQQFLLDTPGLPARSVVARALPKLRILAAVPSSASSLINKGEEICISYLDVNLSRLERQTFLKEKYSFECTCTRCKG